MKSLVFALFLVIANTAHAIGDIERGILFVSNATSFGTFLPDMEGEIAVMKAKREKQLAEYRLTLEKNRQVNLKKMIEEQIKLTSGQIEDLEKQKEMVTQKASSFQTVVNYSEALFSQKLQLEQIEAEIRERNELDPELALNWNDLFQNADNSGDQGSPSANDIERIFMQALFVQAQFEGLERSIEMQIQSLNESLKLYQEQLKALS